MKACRTNNKRGFTLVELTIVLAVMAIATALVVTFTSLTSDRRQQSQARLDALEDVRVCEAVIDGWISENAADIAAFADGASVLETADKALSLEGEKLYTTKDKTKFQRVSTVTRVTFSSQGTDNAADARLYFCTVTYGLRTKAGYQEEDYTFCVYPKAQSVTP